MTNEEKAIASVCTPAKLHKRLLVARSMLRAVYRRRFSNPTLDFSNGCMYSDDGKLKLQWRTRRMPDQPESYENQQTNTGLVTCEAV